LPYELLKGSEEDAGSDPLESGRTGAPVSP